MKRTPSLRPFLVLAGLLGCRAHDVADGAIPSASATGTAPSVADCRVERSSETPAPHHLTGGNPEDVLRLAFWREQKPNDFERPINGDPQNVSWGSERYSGRPKRGRPPPGLKYAYVRAFSFQSTHRSWRQELGEDSCEAQVLSETGRLCPTVAFDGPRLNEAQERTLLSLMRTPPTGIRYKCGFDPHHAFVFYDAEDRPLTDVRVCFDCGEWSFHNGAKDAVAFDVYDGLAALCRELGLDHCPRATTREEQDQLKLEYYERAFGQQRPKKDASPAGLRASESLRIPKETRLSELTLIQKRQLCAHRLFEHGSPGAITELPDNRRFWVRGFEECVERFPRCDVPLGDLDDTDFRQGHATDACLSRWVYEHHPGCQWGIDRE